MKRGTARLTAILTSVLLAAAFPHAEAASAEDVFFDDFSGTRPDSAKWLTAEKNWGGTVTQDGRTVDYNGGVIAENVAVRSGNLVLTGCGDRYEGALRGINRDGTRRPDGKRCGGAVATKAYYASGSYEIRAKIAPVLGCCSAMWTFEYEEDASGDALKITNHEIDIEFPGRDENNDFSLRHALCTTWQTEADYRTSSVSCGDQADGAFHTYRFDWHTGSDTETPRVEYYFDGELTYTSYDNIPTNESRFWLGLWFPKQWAGTPDFETAVFEIDYVKITPFHESGDTAQHETYADGGWADAELPKGWLLWHSYSSYSAQDSRLFLRRPNGTVQEISGDFVHAMNGSFGAAPGQIVFMAIDKAADEWDIFVYDNGTVSNLTQNSGFRNEDPKWAPDGKQILFKRGRWDSAANDFIYDLALLDIGTGAVSMLTNDSLEEAMPCYSPDGRQIFYAAYSGGIGSVFRMDAETRTPEPVFAENGVNAYYPAAWGNRVLFTKWFSAENRCDQIMCFGGGEISRLPFNSDVYDCSDACPVSDTELIYSSTKNGAYDLFFYDGARSSCLTDLNTAQNDLGAAFYPAEPGDVDMNGSLSAADVRMLQKWLAGEPNAALPDPDAADMNGDSRLDARDLSLMKQTLLRF
ncbi:MAG: family 16 glycosylhydrolase [Oscillospiraceae bacterium]|nr:family 16 glycosylhydrolase [Oscillospiraceae bacterium]